MMARACCAIPPARLAYTASWPGMAAHRGRAGHALGSCNESGDPMTLQPDSDDVSAVLRQRTLVAFDGSPYAEYAFESALSLATMARARTRHYIVNHAPCSVIVARRPQ